MAPLSSRSRFSFVPSGPRARRRSTNIETANLLATLVRANVKTLAFTRTRRGAELVLRYTREALENSGSLLAGRVAAYRAGYTPEERRRLEQDFMQRRAAWPGQHQCAGAGRGYRRGGCGADRRIPRHGRQRVAAGRPRRAQPGQQPGRAGGAG